MKKKKTRVWLSVPLEDVDELVSVLKSKAGDNNYIEQLTSEKYKALEQNEEYDRTVGKVNRELEALDKMFKTMQSAGRSPVLRFSPIRQYSLSFGDLGSVNEFKGPTKANFYHYQPRKKLVWLQFKKGDIVNNQYRDNLFPFTLAEARRLKFQTPGNYARQQKEEAVAASV